MKKYKININDVGYLIFINNRCVRTPCEIITTKIDIIKIQIINLNLKNIIIKEVKKENIENIVNSLDEEIFKFIPNYKRGYIRDIKDNRDYSIEMVLKDEMFNSSNKLSTVDYTDQMSSVKNQGNAGTCVAFAINAMKEWQEQIEYESELKEENYNYKRKEKHYNLSEMWTYYKSKEIDPWPNEEGTSIRSAMQQVCKYGIPNEKAWKYNDREKTKPESWATMIAKWRKGKSYFRVNNVNELKESLIKYGPIVIGILCYREIFETTSNGVVHYPKNISQCYGGHAICIVGYDEELKLFKFKNSWGKSWGEKGYGYLHFEYIKNFMMDAWVLIDYDVTKKELSN